MTTFLGLCGAGLVLLGYAMLVNGKWDATSDFYLGCSVVGAALLVIDATRAHQWHYVVLNGVAVCVGVRAWWRSR